MKKETYLFLDPDVYREKYGQALGEISPFSVGFPLVDVSEREIEEIYYYRQHSFCKHIRKTPEGYVITEFYPAVPWAGKYNTINCPAAHHLYEGRWHHDHRYLNDYIRFWFTEDADRRKYSFWAADSVLAVCKVTGDFSLAEELYEDLKENFAAWETSHGREMGLYYQTDGRDGMEYSIGGSGIRPTICSYMYADAKALREIAKMLGRTEDESFYFEKAEFIRSRVEALLWDPDAAFYKTLSETKNYTIADVRELIGYVPWCFNLPMPERSVAWKFLKDEKHFAAPYGPTTAERCHPDFMKWFDHECLWNGPSWPYATAQTITALGNLLANYQQTVMKRSDYFNLLKLYAHEQYDVRDGKRVPYVDENLDPFTGEWLARKLLAEMKDPPGGFDRGEDYNHSTYCDLVINGLVGIRPAMDDILTVKPMFAEEDLDYLAADGILYHGHAVTVLWDKTGEHYQRGQGFHIYVDGKEMFSSKKPSNANITLQSKRKK